MEKRIYGIDILKLVCAFLVICIHCPFFGGNEAGAYIVAVARAGTTTFFVITGYFLSEIIEKEKIRKYLVKIIKMVITGHTIYFFFYWMFSEISLQAYISSFISYKNIRDMLLFNYTPVSGHLWYLSALIYAVIFFTFCYRMRLEKIIVALSPILLVIDEIFGKYSLVFGGGV